MDRPRYSDTRRTCSITPCTAQRICALAQKPEPRQRSSIWPAHLQPDHMHPGHRRAIQRTDWRNIRATQTTATVAERLHPDERKLLLKTTGPLPRSALPRHRISRMIHRQDRRDDAPPRGRGGDGEGNPGNNLHVSGLATRTTDDDLHEVFGKFGKVCPSLPP